MVLKHKAIFWLGFIQKEPSKGFMNLSILCHNFKLFKVGKMSAAGETNTDFGHREGPFICFYILLSGDSLKNKMNHRLLLPCITTSRNGPKLCSKCVLEWDLFVSAGEKVLSRRGPHYQGWDLIVFYLH